MRVAVCTTFSKGFPTAEAMLESFHTHWPKDIDLYIDLDPMSDEEFSKVQEEFSEWMPDRNVFINATWSDEKKKFLSEHKDEGADYRFHACRFSHKVFTLSNVANNTQADYLVWLDADVITKKEVTWPDLKSWLPIDDEVTYLGRRKAPHSECGFVAYNLKTARVLIEYMKRYYTTDALLSLPGWTDCDVFDAARNGFKGRSLYKEGGDGWHVFPYSDLKDHLEHYKGARKFGQPKPKHFSMEALEIKTRNCQPNQLICDNIRENLRQITHWAKYCQPHNEELVICSAGDSLSYTDIKPWADKGVKIVTVKHAIDRLKQWGIKPWACVLLDPRQHVEKFVEAPDKDVVYFVASMVAPNVVKTLLDHGCTVIGYHAFVGAGERELLSELEPKSLLVSGGSATATRSIGLFAECLGFKKIHGYGYDLCYFDQPDMSVKNDDGNAKYLSVPLETKSWGNKSVYRHFWTEGQFLAQAQELRDLCKMPKEFTIELYGPGMAAWYQSHHKQMQAWIERENNKHEELKHNGPRVDDWINAARGVISGDSAAG